MTWLYIVGVHPSDVRPLTGGTPTHVVGSSLKKHEGRELLELSAIGRRLSPPAFASWLVGVARKVSR